MPSIKPLKWKLCSKCRKRKLNTSKNYQPSKNCRDSLSTVCRTCHNEMTRAWIKKNKERYYRVKYRRYNEDPIFYLLSIVKSRAKIMNVCMDLTYDWVKKNLTPGVCQVTGAKLDMDITHGQMSSSGNRLEKISRANPLRPSIDRKNNRLGYTTKNSRIVCWWYNHSKNDWDDKIVLSMARLLVARYG